MAPKTRSMPLPGRKGPKVIRPQSSNPMFSLGLAKHHAGDLDGAEALYRQILSHNPRHAHTWHHLGALQSQRGDHASAVESFSAAIAQNGSEGLYYTGLASSLLSLGRLEEGLRASCQAVKLSPSIPEAHNNQGSSLFRLGQREEAVPCFREAIRLRPDYVDAIFNLGHTLNALGRLAEAEEAYRSVLNLSPSHPTAHRQMAIVLKGLGRREESAEYFHKCVALNPQDDVALYGLGVLAQDLDRHAEAEGWYRRALDINPASLQARFALGTCLKRQERLGEAETVLREVLSQQPDHADAHLSLAHLLHLQGRTSEALEGYRDVLRLKSDSVEAMTGLGSVLVASRESEEDLRGYQEVLELQPDNFASRIALGVLQKNVGRWTEAEQNFREAVELAPDNPDARMAYASYYLEVGRFAEAVKHYREVIRLKPELPKAHLALGVALKENGESEKARQACLESLRLDPAGVDSLWSLGALEVGMGQFEEGYARCAAALRLKPTAGMRIRTACLLPVIYDSSEQVRELRQRVEEDVEQLLREGVTIDDPVKSVGYGNFYISYQGYNDRELNQKIGRFYAPHAPDLSEPRPAGKKIRVGLISKFFKNHTIGKFMLGLTAFLPRERFEVVVLSVGKHDDPVSEEFRKNADQFMVIPSRLQAARKQISALGLDVLFYSDIGMDPFTYFLAFSRLAPVQCVTWGHPVTTGIPNMDYFLSSVDLEPEGAEDHYSEKLVRFRSLPTYYVIPRMDGPMKKREGFLISDRAKVYFVPQNLFKMHPAFDGVLADILRRDPLGQLYLIDGLEKGWNEALLRRFERTLPHAKGRIHFIPRQTRDNFLSLVAQVDVVLDPAPFGGGTTSYEAFAMAAPIITMPGEFMRGRVTYACYKKMGVMDAVATGPEEYAELAVRTVNDLDFRRELRGKIRDSAHRLYEDREILREMEDFLVGVVEKARAGHP